jgi:DNA-binding PadR family transcriptional regulator
MTDDKFDELAQSFFLYIMEYIRVDTEMNLKDEVKTYITKVNRAIELKLDPDAGMYAGVIIRSLIKLDYFEQIEKSKIYRLTDNGKEYIRNRK